MTETEVFVTTTEPAIPVALLLCLLCEFFVGAIVGATIRKDQKSWLRGMAITMGLALMVIVYGIILATLTMSRFPIEHLPIVLSFILAVIST